ncbi:MAG TPA: riboflavin synthase [Acidobacteriaceae bacterium]|jgi:riboflavin synthase|nr:riboflavin synthase [Acidobacteriaceae bacterium]
MFTGLIETTGTLLAVKPTGGAMRLIIAAPQLAGRWKIGDSIAVNGVCLTALDMEDPDEPHPGRFAADLAQETIDRSSLAHLQPGALLNLELPTPAGSPLGGHVVQGHVDATGTLISLVPLHRNLDATDWRMTVELPPQLAAQVIPQGSITIDGISLTVAKIHPPIETGLTRIEIAVIPHTYKSTNLHSKLTGDLLNIETDVLSKYAAQQLVTTADPTAATASLSDLETSVPSLRHAPAKKQWLTAEYLLANGY